MAWRSRPLTSEKMAELTPSARARVRTATAVNPGDFLRTRRAKRTSARRLFMNGRVVFAPNYTPWPYKLQKRFHRRRGRRAEQLQIENPRTTDCLAGLGVGPLPTKAAASASGGPTRKSIQRRPAGLGEEPNELLLLLFV